MNRVGLTLQCYLIASVAPSNEKCQNPGIWCPLNCSRFTGRRLGWLWGYGAGRRWGWGAVCGDQNKRGVGENKQVMRNDLHLFIVSSLRKISQGQLSKARVKCINISEFCDAWDKNFKKIKQQRCHSSDLFPVTSKSSRVLHYIK